MVRYFCFLMAFGWVLLSQGLKAQTKYKTTTGNVSFFSETPIENIDAHSREVLAAVAVPDNKVAVVIPVKSFQFKNSLMQEHFNEKYMESDKYPKATFSGTINEKVDLNKDGVYKVSVTGKLTIHGVGKERTLDGVITVNKGNAIIVTDFLVKPADHNIEIPTLLFQKIAEEILVKVNLELKKQ